MNDKHLFDKDRARALLAAGMPMHDVAEDCGVSYNTIRSWVQSKNIPHRKSPTKSKSDRSCRHIPEWRFTELWKRGYSSGVIAYIYDVTGDALYQHARRQGWISNSEGQQPITMNKIPKWYLDRLKEKIRA